LKIIRGTEGPENGASSISATPSTKTTKEKTNKWLSSQLAGSQRLSNWVKKALIPPPLE